MLLIVGLGNPGKEYAQTRHNFGFMTLDSLAAKLEVPLRMEKKFNTEVGELHGGRHATDSVMLIKPQTFMNRSGEAVGNLARFYKIEPKNIWVIADDLDLNLGQIRVRLGGETGGHHGLDSIVASLGTKEFPRLRLGIRGETMRQMHTQNNIDTASFVTSSFTKEEQPLAQRVVQTTVDILLRGLEQGELTSHSYEVDGFDEHIGEAA